MTSTVPHRHLWSPDRLSSADLQALLDTAATLKRAKQRGQGWGPLRGRHLALLCSREDEAAQTFQRAIHELGGTVALLDAQDWRSSAGERVPDAARMLGRLYDAVDCVGLPAPLLEQIDAHSGVPVFNGVAQAGHPLAAVSALLTMREAGDKPLHQLHVQLAGDAEAPQQQAAATLARLAGVDVQRQAVAAAPDGRTPQDEGPDFVFDPLPAQGRLTKPEADAAEQARIAELLASNRECTLQALMVCTLQ